MKDNTEDYYNSTKIVTDYIKAAAGVDSKQLIEKLSSFLIKGTTLLELGTGPGTDWEKLNTLYNVTGSDFSIFFLEHLIANYPHGNFIKVDAEELVIAKQYDGVYANKVLHHLNDSQLKSSLKNHVNILNSKGIACHSYWNGEGDEYFDKMYVNYHTREELASLYEPYFDILLIELYKEFEEGDSIVVIARKK